VCACFAVGPNTIIVEAIRSGNLCTVTGISDALRAGTNCRSCLPELAVVLHETRAEERTQGELEETTLGGG
jgi:assimilatory nitrate reductase catalytic subunit